VGVGHARTRGDHDRAQDDGLIVEGVARSIDERDLPLCGPLRQRSDDPARWGQVAEQGVDLHWFPGDHYTMALEPAIVRLVAARLRHCLARC